jgi:RNA polymerase sigma-70 factor (ECF subfamily)
MECGTAMGFPAWFGQFRDVAPAGRDEAPGWSGVRPARNTPSRITDFSSIETTGSASGVDDDILAELRANDTAAFERLFRRMLDPLVDFAIALGVTREVGQDVVADVFFSVWKNRHDWAPTNVAAYFFGAVRKRVQSAHHLAHRTVDLATALDNEAHVAAFIDPAASADAEIAESDLLGQLDRVLDTLPPLRRAVITLRLREQLSYAEIATILGVSENAAQAHVSRAMKAIRSAIPGLL